jgi:hypothetical protein
VQFNDNATSGSLAFLNRVNPHSRPVDLYAALQDVDPELTAHMTCSIMYELTPHVSSSPSVLLLLGKAAWLFLFWFVLLALCPHPISRSACHMLHGSRSRSACQACHGMRQHIVGVMHQGLSTISSQRISQEATSHMGGYRRRALVSVSGLLEHMCEVVA